MRRTSLIFLALSLPACAAFPAGQMRLPANVQANSAEPISGLTGWDKGRFAVAGYSGNYKRSDRRMTYFDTFDRRIGDNSFTIQGPAISGVMEARCRMRERSLQFGSVSVNTNPIAYRCDLLAGGLPLPAHFELQSTVSGPAGLLSRHERRGEIALGGEVLQFRSIHHLKGTSMGTDQPIGYVFERWGTPVGTIELNGRPRLFAAPALSPDAKRTFVVGAMALALLRDPAGS